MNKQVISIESLTKTFGNLTAVDNLSVKLDAGKIYGFIGPNGAGKTTTMSLLVDLIFATKGDAYVKGHKTGTIDAKRMLGYSPEYPSFYTDMTCIDYMIYMGSLGGLSYKESVEKSLELLKYMNLENHMYKKVAKFSTGMKKKVGLSQAMIHNPDILLLDEPTANLDPTSRMELISTLKKLVKEKNLTLVISSHVLTELELIITDVIMIDKGRLIMYGPLEEVKNKFNNDVIVIKTSNNQLMESFLEKDEFVIDVKEVDGSLKITTKDLNKTRKYILKCVYENDLTLDKIGDDNVSLDDVYRSLVMNKAGEK